MPGLNTQKCLIFFIALQKIALMAAPQQYLIVNLVFGSQKSGITTPISKRAVVL